MHFLFHCFKSAPCAFHFVEIFYFEEVFFKNGWNFKPSILKTIEIWKRSHRASKYMLKFQDRNTRTRWEIILKLTIKTPERRHWPESDVFIVNFTYFTVYSSVSIVEFEQVNVCQEHTLPNFIYPRVEWRHRYNVFIVNFEHISHLVLVFLLLILSMYLIAEFDIWYFCRF